MRIKLLIFYIFFVSVCAFSFECDAIDTLFRNSDTLVTKYRCYDNGNKKNGIVKGWNELGDLVSHYEFRNGIPVGFHKSYYSKNRPKEFTHYNDSGQKHGLCETWFENGNRKDSVVYNNGKIVEGRYYFRNGKLRYTAKWHDSLKIEMVTFYPDGRKCSELKSGTGEIKLFIEDGTKSYQYKYKDGRRID